MPEGVVYVGRPSAHGNEFVLPIGATPEDRRVSLASYRAKMEQLFPDGIPSLRGKDLSCWCVDWDPSEGPAPGVCHGEILLELANPEFRNAAHTGPGREC